MRNRTRAIVPLLLAMGVGFGLARWGVPETPAAANPRSASSRATPAPEAFRSGGERSVAVLREIARTVKSIDDRLARIEERFED